MFKFKGLALLVARRMLNKCRKTCDIYAIRAKISANKKRTAIIAFSVLFTIACTLFSVNYRVGYTVKVKDVVLGTVATKGEYYEVLDEVKTEVSNISEISFEPVSEESFSMEIVPVSSFTEKEELAENVKAIADGMAESYTITSDGQFVIALHTEEEANRLVESYLESFKSEKFIEVSYATEVLVENLHAPYDAIKDYSQAEAEFMLGEVKNHTVAQNETIESIAESYGVLSEEILADNGIEKIEEGIKLKIYTDKPIIPIKTVEYINGNVEIPFDVLTREDDSVYKGQTRIETKGVNGEKYLHAYITKIDGIVTEENIIETEIISLPTTQVELTGTKEPPKSVGTGTFIMPASGTLTSNFGRRWGKNHNGIDIAATTGTPIYATDNGVVVEAEYQSNGYGNIVKIDHQNGYVSYYAHCSKLYVNAGDVVAKGDLIAAIGNTGRSTGPHLHFEIRQNDKPKNPYRYIK